MKGNEMQPRFSQFKLPQHIGTHDTPNIICMYIIYNGSNNYLIPC